MEEEVRATRVAVVQSIETILSHAFPKNLRGERINILEELKEWAKEFARERNMEIDFRERTEPVTRKTIILKGARPYVIAVHDPMGQPRGVPAESITGADYAVEFPIDPKLDKLLFVQLKRKSYGMPPKQYFGMGAAYMFTHYLGMKWSWFDRFQAGAEYVTKRRNPHKEFLFLKVIGDDLYIPLSSVFRTFKPKNYKLETNLAKKLPKSGVAEYKETATYVEFSIMRQHLSEYYVGLTEFMKAANSCRIGVEHGSTLMNIRRKADTLFFLSRMLFRPNVVILETTRSMLPRLTRIL